MKRPTQQCAEIHQALIPRPRLANRQRVVSGSLHLLCRERGTCNARINASDVGVHDSGIVFEREREDSTRRVRPDTWEREQPWERPRELCEFSDLLGGQVQVSGATRIAEAEPQPEHLAKRCVATRARCCKRREKRAPLRYDAIYLGLLQHDLAHENRPWVARVPPRKIA